MPLFAYRSIIEIRFIKVGGGDLSECGWHQSMGQGPRLDKKEDVS